MNTLAGPMGTVDWFVNQPFHGSLTWNGAPTNLHFDNIQKLHRRSLNDHCNRRAKIASPQPQ
jgi:hypothetical protein